MLHCDKEFIVPVQTAVTTKALLLKTRHCYSKFSQRGAQLGKRIFRSAK